MRKSGLTGDEAYVLSKRRGTSGDLGPLKKELSLLKEDLSNKITKFYASNQGETHLADSDNGKIMDMMLYGKSEQFTTIGKNLLKIRDGTQTARGITITAKDGVVELKGIAAESGWAIFDIDSFVLDGTYILSSNITADIRVKVVNKSFKTVMEQDKSVTLENVEVSRVCFVVTKGETYDVSNILIQIEKGSVATSYEPYTGGIPSPNPSYPQEIKSVVNPTVKLSNEDGTQSETVTLPYTLNAIPVSSGGNVTINGQQYIADYVDVERGKLVKCVEKFDLSLLNVRESNDKNILFVYSNFNKNNMYKKIYKEVIAKCSHLKVTANSAIGAKAELAKGIHVSFYGTDNNSNIDNVIYVCVPLTCGTTIQEFLEWANKNAFEILYILATPTEINLTSEEIIAFKALATYYPTTNISVNSDELDGYTVISMANGWNYVKQQLNDNRDYIYDMDLQSAEAYVNSEYAVTLTELEV